MEAPRLPVALLRSPGRFDKHHRSQKTNAGDAIKLSHPPSTAPTITILQRRTHQQPPVAARRGAPYTPLSSRPTQTGRPVRRRGTALPTRPPQQSRRPPPSARPHTLTNGHPPRPEEEPPQPRQPPLIDPRRTPETLTQRHTERLAHHNRVTTLRPAPAHWTHVRAAPSTQEAPRAARAKPATAFPPGHRPAMHSTAPASLTPDYTRPPEPPNRTHPFTPQGLLPGDDASHTREASRHLST